ncbi:MAG: glycosyltransferase family 2 protein [Spirochaetes bacterium]|jgi:glycosyltransferase involved in cell wall biosynthesis|nr:glycosyltransferase family 2 protein [Spirochaetota bacterium]
MKNAKSRVAVIIPLYNHINAIADVVQRVKKNGYTVVVVDDCSTDGSYENVQKINDIVLLHHEQNRGKGAAIITGLSYLNKDYDWAVTIDADGQHFPEEIDLLISRVSNDKKCIVIGNRLDLSGPNVTWKSSFGRLFSNFWVRLSGGPGIQDSQSGFRMYPVRETLDLHVVSRRFEFEIEVLVRAKRSGFTFIEAGISVFYPPVDERISHFKPFHDFMRNSRIFSMLIIERIFRMKNQNNSTDSK